MRSFRLLIVALVTILALALGVFGLIHPPGQITVAPGDDIIIKGGSMSDSRSDVQVVTDRNIISLRSSPRVRRDYFRSPNEAALS